MSKNYFMKIKISLLLILFVSASIHAQKSEPIQTDRPDQTETPAIVPIGMFQIETGFTFQKNDALSSTFSIPSTLWKYGVNDNFELRVITEFISEKINNQKANGFTPIYFGFKVKLSEEKGVFPKTSLIAHVGIPNSASKQYKTDFFAPDFRFTMQHSISEKMSLSYNLGAEWDGFTTEPTFIYTLTTGYSITKNLGSYIELFGFSPQYDKSKHNFAGGLTYLINDNFMVDLSSSAGITNNAPAHYFAFGFSFRI